MAEDRKETIERLYEEIRRALNNFEYDKASRLAFHLSAEIGDDEFVRSMNYPVCLGCNGYGEVVDPKDPARKAMCTSAPAACYGNRHGRMTPEDYGAYLDAKLKPLQPSQTEVVAKSDAEGNVPRLPPDEIKPTVITSFGGVTGPGPDTEPTAEDYLGAREPDGGG